MTFISTRHNDLFCPYPGRAQSVTNAGGVGSPVYATITIAGTISAQGVRLFEHPDGRVTISTGAAKLTGWPVHRSQPRQ